MKNFVLVSLAIVLSFASLSCKKEPQFSVEPKTVTINWTGYKTTSKIPVKGEFKIVEVSNIKEATTAVESLNGTKFSIPVSSIFSGDDERDGKLKQLFFGVMDATVSLTGTVNLKDDGTGTVNLSMNGVSKAKVKYQIEHKVGKHQKPTTSKTVLGRLFKTSPWVHCSVRDKNPGHSIVHVLFHAF